MLTGNGILIVLAMVLAAPADAAAAGPAGRAPEWRTLPTDAYPKKRDDIFFADSKTGFYGTGAGNLYRTEDGGQSWAKIWSRPGTFIRALAFLDPRHGFLGNLGAGLAGTTDDVPFYRTEDGGRSWTPVELPKNALPGICSIDILRSKAIVEGRIEERIIIHAAGRANGPAKLVRSEDGGKSWRVIDLSDRAGMILDVKFVDPSIGFVFAGTNGDVEQSNALILKTSDGGRSWREVYRSKRKFEIIWKAAFPAPKVAYATLQNNDPGNVQQRLLKTTDGGDHWREMPLVANAAAQEFGIGFTSANRGWIGTSVGGFATGDGGRTWHPSPLAPQANKIRVTTGDGKPMIYAIGSEVQMLR